MNLKIIAKTMLFAGILVQILWGFIANAWAISWIASFTGVMLMCILNVIANGMEKNKKDNEKSDQD